MAPQTDLVTLPVVSHSRATPLARHLIRFVSALSNLASTLTLRIRSVQTESLPPSAAVDILNAQRIKRPSSPHFTIYEPQITWIGSIANRVTGGGLSAGE